MAGKDSRRSLPVDLALVVASSLVALLIAEACVRIFDFGPRIQVVYQEIFTLSDDPVLRYELRPGASDGVVSINHGGFRGRETPIEKPESVFRIVAIGDSVTFGIAVEQAAAYPGQLERLLNLCAVEGGPTFEVLNLGVTGYNITQVVERLRVLGLAYQPDLILYGYVLNDTQGFSFEAEALKDIHDEMERLAFMGRGAGRLLNRSRLYRLVRYGLSMPVESTVAPEAVDLRYPWDPGYRAYGGGDTRGRYFHDLHATEALRARLGDGLSDLARLAREAQVPAVVAIFPLFLASWDRDYPLADVHDLVTRAVHENGLAAVDLLPAFKAAAAHFGSNRFAADFMHPSASGYLVAAIAVLARMNDLDRLPAGSIDVGQLSRQGGDTAEIYRLLSPLGASKP